MFEKTPTGWRTTFKVLDTSRTLYLTKVEGRWKVDGFDNYGKTRRELVSEVTRLIADPILTGEEEALREKREKLPPAPASIPETFARLVYEVLVEECQAYQGGADDFALHSGYTHEYRFRGSLGFGGKFWNNEHWYVTCYLEDRTLVRREKMIRANRRLLDLEAKHAGC